MNTNLIFSTAIVYFENNCIITHIEDGFTIVSSDIIDNDTGDIVCKLSQIIKISTVQKIGEFWFKKSDVEEITFIKATHDIEKNIYYYVGTCKDIDGKEHYILKTKFSNNNFVLEIEHKEYLFLTFPSLNEY